MSHNLKSRLEQWVDRGDSIGPLALLQRVEADLDDRSAVPTPIIDGGMRAPKRRGWLVAAASAAAVVIVLGLIPWLLRPAGTTETADTPTTLATTTTIVPNALEPSKLPTFNLESVPAFSGTISVAWGDLAVLYGGGRSGLRVDLVDASQSSGDFRGPFGNLGEGGPGSYLVYDGRNGVLNLKREGIVEPLPGDHLLDLFDMIDWRLPTGGLGDLCTRMQHVATGVENVAGHWAHVLVCDGLGQSFTIWVDAETGLILRLRNGVLDSGVDPVLGDFEFTGLDYNPPIPADSFLTGLTEEPVPLTPEIKDPVSLTPEQNHWVYVRYLTESSNELFANSAVLVRGEEVPPLAGQFLDGTPFDLESLRGKPVLIHFWSPHINQLRWADGWTPHTDLEALDSATLKWGESLHYVSIARGDADLVTAIVDEFDLAVPPVIPTDPHPWDLMNPIWPAWILIDGEGKAVAAFQNVYPAELAVDLLVDLLDQDLPTAESP